MLQEYDYSYLHIDDEIFIRIYILHKTISFTEFRTTNH